MRSSCETVFAGRRCTLYRNAAGVYWPDEPLASGKVVQRLLGTRGGEALREAGRIEAGGDVQAALPLDATRAAGMLF